MIIDAGRKTRACEFANGPNISTWKSLKFRLSGAIYHAILLTVQWFANIPCLRCSERYKTCNFDQVSARRHRHVDKKWLTQFIWPQQGYYSSSAFSQSATVDIGNRLPGSDRHANDSLAAKGGRRQTHGRSGDNYGGFIWKLQSGRI